MKGVKVNAVDTTGAGDSFVGGVLNSLSSNLDIYKVIIIAHFLNRQKKKTTHDSKTKGRHELLTDSFYSSIY